MNPTYYKQENYFPQQNPIEWDVCGHAGMGVSLSGTFTSGYFILEGTGNGETWDLVKIAKGTDQIVPDGRITEVGNYSALVYGFSKVKLTPVDVVGALTLKSLVIPQLPPPFLFGE